MTDGRTMTGYTGALSVVLCAYSDRRFGDLRDAIRSVLPQLAEGDEVIVVIDHNPWLRERVTSLFPDLQVIDNDGPRGLSGARNTGIAAARGSILLFLDDDATAAPGMVDGLRGATQEPLSLGAVARIVPAWLGPDPRWFPAEFLWTVGCTYEGMRPGPVRNLIGAAMAVRRSVFDTVGGFDTGLGRKQAGLPLGCEETELCIRAARAFPGKKFHYVPTSVCHHKVPADRATLRYLGARCLAEGLSKASLRAVAGSQDALSSERTYVTRTLPRGIARGIWSTLRRGEVTGGARAGTIAFGFASTVAGYALGRLRLAWSPTDGATRPVTPLAGDATAGEGGP